MIAIQQHKLDYRPTDSELAVYVSEIRRRVCSRCPQRPLGRPPCASRGKLCGVELHLPLLIDAIRDAPGDDHRSHRQFHCQRICEGCVLDARPACPCAIETCSDALLAAVSAADDIVRKLREEQSPVRATPRSNWPGLRAIYRLYRVAAGTWTGCDWPTRFSPSLLDLNDWPSVGAAIMARKARSPKQRRDWHLAGRWLAQIEQRAKRAELLAGLAVAAANVGQWQESRKLAAEAWALESATGRPFFRALPPAWQRLTEAIEAAMAHGSRMEAIQRDEVPRANDPGGWPVISIPSALAPQGVPT